jgi:hypothetical protein
VLFVFPWELIMKKIVIATVAILAVSTSGAFAKHHKMMKPKDAAATTTPAPMMGMDTAANTKMMMKNKHDAGMK